MNTYQLFDKKRFTCLLLAAIMAFGSLQAFFIGSFADEDNNDQENEVTALKSEIVNMDLEGYVGENLIGNVKNWQMDAYHNNRGIIDQIAIANAEGLGLEKLLGTDYFGVDGCYTIDVHEKDGGMALGWTMNKVPTTADTSSFDRDIRYAGDPTALTNWTGAKELWVKIDASEISTETRVRIAFEENAVGRESFSLIPGAKVRICAEGETEGTEQTVLAGGFVNLPASFKGTLCLPLNTDTFSRYWQEGGNGTLDLSKVVQFQLSVKGDFVGKTLYMDNFAIVGDVDGQALAERTDSYKVIWSLDGVSARYSYTGSIVIWYGEFVGKLLTGMAFSYKATADKDLKSAADEIITDLAAAQSKDGYLGVFLGGARYSLSSGNWDLWNQYHCIVGLLEWYRLTRNETALDVATKALDCIYETFKGRSYIVVGGFETNRGIAHGYALMYQTTKNEKYLNEAIRIIEEDCKKNKGGWYEYALSGKEFAASNCTRWEVLHMVMTLGILYEETGNKEYYEVMSAVWESVLRTDIHNGGTFTTDEGACGDPFREGIVETCCTIAWAAFTNEYYKYNKSVRVADELERSYLNGILGGLLDDDKYCTYNTPMDGIQGSSTLHGGHYDGRRVPSQKDISFQYNSTSPDMNCCQANIARGIGQLAEWALMTEGNTLYLNYYGPSAITTTVGGKKVTLTQQTEYPLNGAVKLTISGLEEDTEFTLKLRIPTWGYGSTVTLDGKTVTVPAGEYYTIEKTFKNGDTVTLDLAMSFTYLTGEGAQNGYASAFWGPVLLTLDKYYASAVSQNVKFTVKAIESAVISSGKDTDAMLLFEVTLDDDKKVTLVDFASAGKYHEKKTPSAYWSWLKIEDAPAKKESVTWLNTDRQKILCGENIKADKITAYSGDEVSFTVTVPEGQVIDTVTSSVKDVKITMDGEKGTFLMPKEEITLSVSFKEAGTTPKDPTESADTDKSDEGTSDEPSNTPADEDSSKDPSKASVVGAIFAVAAAVATAIVAITFALKNKKKKEAA